MGPICASDFREKGPISWVSYKLDFSESKKIQKNNLKNKPPQDNFPQFQCLNMLRQHIISALTELK